MREKRKSRKRHNKRGQILTPVIFLTSLLLFAAGVGIFIYPALSNYLAQREQKEVIGFCGKELLICLHLFIVHELFGLGL